MIHCDQTKCRHCYYETKGGPLVCTVDDPSLISIPSMRSFILKCNDYQKREDGSRSPGILLPYDHITGLYPGQIKPRT